VRHIADGMLRRLVDEPLAVPDRVSDHLAGCERCSDRRARIAQDADSAARLLSAPQLVPDTGLAWGRLERELHRVPQRGTDRRRTPVTGFRRRRRSPTVSLRAGLVIGAVGTVVAGTAAAATLTTIFAPTHIAPVSVSRSDLRAITAFMGGSHGLGGFSTPSGSRTLPFGTIKWSSSGPARAASSLAEATAETGLTASLPEHLPAGVGSVQRVMVQPRVSATVTFNSRSAGLGGSSVTLHAGPAVLVQYAALSGPDVPALGVMTMPRPTALSTGATVSQIEAFLLNQPVIPPELAEEVRLLGDLRTTLPVPVPPGASVRSVRVAGWPGVLVADPSNVAAGVVWEDGGGMLHAVAGILDSRDVLNVADQLG
jgi:hypothetical protein